MEAAGCYFDVDRCNQAATRAAVDAQELLSRWEAVAPSINPESPIQLSTLLYTTRGFPIPPIAGTLKAVKRTKRGERPTGEASLDWLYKKATQKENKELLSVLLQLRKTTKLAQFLAKLPTFVDSRGYLYAAFGPDTGTLRLSSRNPNLQQIPGVKSDRYGLRSCFIAPPGYRLLIADYSALEPRILAIWLILLFGDYSLAQALKTGDVYGAMAKQIWPTALQGIEPQELKHHSSAAVRKMRDDTKIVFLAKVYGKGIPGMAMQMGKSIKEAAQVDTDFLATYPGIAEFQAASLREAQSAGRVLSLIGQSRQIRNANSSAEGERARAARQATNTKCQMSAAGVVYGAMVKQRNRGGVLQIQVHDELCWRIRDEEDPAPLIDAMRFPFKKEMPVDLEVDWKLCNNWAEMK
jgi:DNA polymerase I-like protein with 3'-5' exonuclease and polymerase domains